MLSEYSLKKEEKCRNTIIYNIEGKIFASGTARPPSREPIEPNFLR